MTTYIITEDGDKLITEDGLDKLITETLYTETLYINIDKTESLDFSIDKTGSIDFLIDKTENLAFNITAE